VHRVGKKAENQGKSREKSKVVENQVLWLDFCTKKRNMHTPSGVPHHYIPLQYLTFMKQTFLKEIFQKIFVPDVESKKIMTKK
jgi:hypothetical protein